MHRTAPTRSAARLACAFLLLSASLACAQAAPGTSAPPSSALPANRPTTLPHPHPRSTATRQAKRAEVAYSDGMLSVSADNSSLNQILRQISLETGMKITGGVTDERVFGHYGPSAPSQVLAALLDGTGSNMLLLHRDSRDPAELVLTPRMGGPTPPSPNAAVFNEQPEPQNPPEAQEPQESPEPNGTGQPNPSTESNQPAPDAASPGQTNPSEPGEPESPNGVKTPQQIYQQLQQLRQQQPPPK